MEVQVASPQTATVRARPRPKPRDNAPTDGFSHYNPAVAVWARPLNRVAMWLMFKKDYQGLEKIPDSGGYLLCPNHQAMVDAPLVASLTNRDNRFMAAKEQFHGPQGWLMRNAGAFPVDRKNPGPKPIQHSIDMLDQGTPVVMFPEGGIFRTGSVEELKTGAARIATSSACQSIVPVTIHYHASGEPTASRQALGHAAVAGFTALAAAGGMVSPTLRAFTGAITGGLAGTKVAARFELKPLQKVLVTIGGAVTGAAASALAPGTAGLVTALGTGYVAHKFDDYMAHRPTVTVVVSDPLRVEDYVTRYGDKSEEMLTQDLHAVLNGNKQRLHAESPSIYPI